MLDFVFIIGIFTEIILTAICIKKITEFEKKVENAHRKLLLASITILEINEKLKDVIVKINKFVSIVTNKKFIQIKKIVKISIDIIQIIVLIRSLDLSRGLKSINYKNLRKLLLSEGIKHFIKRFA